MSILADQARSRAKDKVERLTRIPKGDVDASGWREPLGENGEVQTGMRVLSRKNYARGGKIGGDKPVIHAGRKPRKSGGKTLTADSYMNRDMKEANQEREGIKQDGGLKKGGRVHKMIGGGMVRRPALPPVRLGNPRPGLGTHPGMGARPFAAGGKVHGKDCTCAKCSGGRVAKKVGGSINDGTRPEGGRIARASGGKAKKGMNVNIIIAPQGGGAKPPMPMPPPGIGGPVGMHQGAPPPMPPPGAAPPMGPPPGMMGRKSGGRVDSSGPTAKPKMPANKVDSSGPTAKPGKYPIRDGAGGGMGRREKIRAYG
jgi:hypothetical protein